MALPPTSSLLERLQAFLPEIEKANNTTNQLVNEGRLEVIDDTLEVAGTDEHAEDDSIGSEEEDGGISEGRANMKPAPQRVVQLDFALGDFDETPIAKMEREAEEAARTTGSKDQDAVKPEYHDVDADASSEERETLCLHPREAQSSASRGTDDGKRRRKPLIEEIRR